jgi:hypothetical protein
MVRIVRTPKALPGVAKRNMPKRADGFIELPWYPRLVFIATKANHGDGWDAILKGPSASGKTTAGYMLAHDLGYEIVVQQCHRRVEVEDFRGTRSIIPGKGGIPVTGFDPGSLTRAIMLCETAKGVVFIIDEINFVDASMLAILHNITQRDTHSALVIPETGKVYPRPRNFIIVGTMNPEYMGTNPLGEALTSRVVQIETPMLSYQQIRDILATHFPKRLGHVEATARIMGYIETCRIQEQHQWEPDLRTMHQFLDIWTMSEPDWKRGMPLNRMAIAFDEIIGPKIGWRDTFFQVRKGLCDGIMSSIGTRVVRGDDITGEQAQLPSSDDEPDAPIDEGITDGDALDDSDMTTDELEDNA